MAPPAPGDTMIQLPALRGTMRLALCFLLPTTLALTTIFGCKPEAPAQGPGQRAAAAGGRPGVTPGAPEAASAGAWSKRLRNPGPGQRALLGDPLGPDAASAGDPPAGWPRMVDVASDLGVRFTRMSGATGRKHYCEPKGGGAAFFDANGDGWPDVYLVDGGPLPGTPTGRQRSNRLFLNQEGKAFVDVTAQAGVAGSGYGMGAAAGDYDGDGRVDLFVTGVGASLLYRNVGEGRFEDVTAAAGAQVSGWSTSALFVDLDEDGDLDLYVARYLDYHPDNNPPCYSAGVHNYCTPHDFSPLPDVVLLNDGAGRFVVAPANFADSDLSGMGLMVAASDLDGDGHLDVYVANDEVPNFLLLGQGKGRFVERALLSGVAVGSSGMAEAGMGVDIGDVDGDGLLDLVVANFAAQPVNYYRNLGRALFADESAIAGVFKATFAPLSFGVRLADLDNDADLDLFVCNGHIWDTVATFQPGVEFPQQNTLLRNTGAGRFEDVSGGSGPGLLLRRPSRGLAVADFDRDGDLDLLYSNQDAPVVLLRNDGGDRQPWLEVRLLGRAPNTAGLGARVELHQAGRVQVREVTTGGGYQSSNDPVVHFGLGAGPAPDKLVVRWPAPLRSVTEVRRPAPRSLVVVRQGS